jgi:hypothetical protein
LCEDPFKEPAVRFVKELQASQEGLEPSHIQSVELKDDALRAFESDVCEQDAMGVWVLVEKLVPKEEESAQAAPGKKAPAPAKGKGPATGIEDLKPIHSKAWLDLKPLLHPGVKTLTQRVLLQPMQQKPDIANSTGMSQTPLATSTEQPVTASEQPEDIYAPCQTYIYLTLNLNEPLFPEANAVKTDSQSLTQKFKDPKKNPSTKDAIATYESAIKYIVSQVGQEYAKKVQEEDSGAANSKNQPSSKGQTAFLSTQQTEVLAEQRREKFLTEFTQSYKYTEIRTRLQEAIFRLGVEKFKKQVGGGKQLDAQAKNKFKAELYIFLQKKLKECLQEAIGESQRQSLPVDIVTQFD